MGEGDEQRIVLPDTDLPLSHVRKNQGDDEHPAARGPRRIPALHHLRAHDRRREKPADHLAGHPLLRVGRADHRRDDRPRLPEEGRRRARATRAWPCSSPTRPGRGSTARSRCSSRGPRRSTTRTSRRTRSATCASPARSCRRRRRCTRPSRLRDLFNWYYARLYIQVRPERVFVWPDGDLAKEPTIHDAHLEEVRSGHIEEPARSTARQSAGSPVWDDRMGFLGEHETGVLSWMGPDGFPIAIRVPFTAGSVQPGDRGSSQSPPGCR